ncbi:MAG: DUF86 domain-containing protein [Candidatus Brocadiae bacterium]|nr:DUF86 domain-containing protein [Candidatus Brocadiia bacterium]
MPVRSDLVRVQHMLEAAQKAVEFARDRTRADLDSDEMFALAMVRLLEIVGEAAKGVSADLRRRCPAIPWRQLAGTRDRLIHGYFDVDFDIVWAIVANDIPPLIAELQKVVSLPRE